MYTSIHINAVGRVSPSSSALENCKCQCPCFVSTSILKTAKKLKTIYLNKNIINATVCLDLSPELVNASLRKININLRSADLSKQQTTQTFLTR